MPAMLGCSTTCPHCKHQFQCCTPESKCGQFRRLTPTLSGGGIVREVVLFPQPCPSPVAGAQLSPSIPLTFILPPTIPVASPQLQQQLPLLEDEPETELLKLTDIVRVLRLSGWYYEGLTFDKSDELLKETKVGTFLVRDSSDPRFLFSLSVQTDTGPKSVRLFYLNKCFRLDAQPHLQSSMPFFPGVVELVQYYVRRQKVDREIWVDPHGKRLSPIYLEKPLRKDSTPSTLKHLSRLAINRKLNNSSKIKVLKLELPLSLSAYLLEYPYSL